MIAKTSSIAKNKNNSIAKRKKEYNAPKELHGFLRWNDKIYKFQSLPRQIMRLPRRIIIQFACRKRNQAPLQKKASLQKEKQKLHYKQQKQAPLQNKKQAPLQKSTIAKYHTIAK